MLYTIIQIIAFQALFLALYDLFLRKETFFNYNRAYLLLTSILSILLPFIKFPQLKAATTKDLIIQLPEVFIGEEVIVEEGLFQIQPLGSVAQTASLPTWQIILGIGMLAAAILLIFKISKLLWLKHQSPKRWKGNVLIVSLLNCNSAFSFFNTIFMGERISKQDEPSIYKHELVHIKEFHSLDLLYFELLRVVFWFNPLVYMYQSRIKELHEYVADAKAVKQQGSSSYYQSLLNQVFDVGHLSLTNTFFKKSLIKKRIAMLQRSKSSQLNLFRYAVLIPLVLAMLIYTSMEVSAQRELDSTELTNQEPSEEQLIKKYYDQMVAMEKDGASFMEIASFARMANVEYPKYVKSKEEYLKSKAYLGYLADSMIKRKSERGNLTDKDFEIADLMKNEGNTYEEYRSWKQTKEAKDLWEASIKDGERRLFVEKMYEKTEAEEKMFNALLKQLETDNSVKRLIVTDGTSHFIIDEASSREKNIEAQEKIEVPFSIIDEVPTIEKCKSLTTNTERKHCMSDFVSKHVNLNFNTSIAEELGIEGRQRIFVAFKIDEKGKVKDIKARASQKELETEAIRVIETLPQFVPGRHKGQTVVVPYSLPIVFQVPDANEKSSTPSYEAFINSLNSKDAEEIKRLISQRNRLLKNASSNSPVIVNLEEQIDSLMKKGLDDIENSNTQELRKKVLQKEGLYPSKVQKEVVYSEVDKAPIHINCKDNKVEVERKKCTSLEVSKFVNGNFNMDVTKNLGLEGETQRIFVKFTIDKSGAVSETQVRAQHPKLKEEAERVIKLLPKFVPGEQSGEPVKVSYTLPISFYITK